MDQLKVFLKQCVKYRFWIALGISLLLPMVGYFVGSGTINDATKKREGEITSAKTEIVKYTTPGIVNNQYQPLAATKKEALTKEVDETWRKLFATQEPLLKWPVEVQDRIRKWGRKHPAEVDKIQVTAATIDYTGAYTEFVERIYKIFKPFNFEDGSGIVVAPPAPALMSMADFRQDEPPDLSRIWAEQERLWVVTALLDVVAKVNESVGAKDWDGAIIKEIRFLEVGGAADQDQKSIAKGELLVGADVLNPDGTVTAAPPPTAGAPAVGPGAGGEGGRGAMGGGPGGGSMSGMAGATKSAEVLYIKTDSPQFKSLPIKLVVLVDQARLPDYIVGLENSPMAIQVQEVEIAKPLSPVMKPSYGERSSFGQGMGGGMGDMMGGGSGMARSMAGGKGGAGGAGRPGGPGGSNTADMMGGGMMSGGMMGGGRSGAPAAAKQGTDVRSKDPKKDREEKAKREAAQEKARAEAKKIDQYFNVIEVTVYGTARFYLAPPPAPVAEPSTSATPSAPEVPAAEAPKVEAPKTEAPQGETPVPAEVPKTDAVPKPEAPKAEVAKPDAPKGDAPTSKP